MNQHETKKNKTDLKKAKAKVEHMWQVACTLTTTAATMTMALLGLTYAKKEDWQKWFSLFFVMMAIMFNIVNAYIPLELGILWGAPPLYLSAIVMMIIATNAFCLYVVYQVFAWMIEAAKNAKAQL